MARYGIKRTFAKIKLHRRLRRMGVSPAPGGRRASSDKDAGTRGGREPRRRSLGSAVTERARAIKARVGRRPGAPAASSPLSTAPLYPGDVAPSRRPDRARGAAAGLLAFVRGFCCMAIDLEALAALCLLALCVVAPAFGTVPYAVLSASMEPALPVGALAVVSEGSRAAVGDVIAFNTASSVVTHRVVEVTDEGSYRTKGDANESEDLATVEPSSVVGVVRAVVPFLGTLLDFLAAHRAAAVCAVALANVVLVAGSVLGQKKRARPLGVPEAA